ncbi:hypothetical protein EU523_00575 [Candidatus Heimdallarchaeota archaeon]|nr:MAG: hypothetical protein EU523_00575 [Candidatus Heimdallarchaeota archaeon]
MSSKPVLFEEISLENFMLHDNTSISLAEKPITLITGANGSGKTQILDAISICLGYIPQRARANGVGSLVGADKETATIKLTIKNPKMSSQRAIWTLKKDLNKALDHNRIQIIAEVDKERSTVAYSITSLDKKSKIHPITRKDNRLLFETINVKANNHLAFTAEGTVDDFASKSPRKKLDALLAISGLKQYREEILQAQETLKDSLKEIEPLKRKFETEKRLLNLWTEAFELIKHRTSLREKKQSLETELIWARVKEFEVELEDFRERKREKVNQEREIEEELDEIDRSLKNIIAEMEQFNNQSESLEKDQQRQQRKVITFETEQKNIKNDIEELSAEMGEYQKQKEELESILEQKSESKPEIKSKEKQERVIDLHQRLSYMTKQLGEIEKQIKETIKQETESKTNSKGNDFQPDFNEEILLLEETRAFKASIPENYEASIIGPLFSLISIRKGKEKWSNAVKNLLGLSLFSFIATTSEAYEIATNLVQKMKITTNPHIVIYQPLPSDKEKWFKHQQATEDNREYYYLSEFLEAESFLTNLIDRISKGVIAPTSIKKSRLREISLNENVDVLTRDCKHFYLAEGGYVASPKKFSIDLGEKISAEFEKSENQSSLKYEDYQIKRVKLEHQAASLREELLEGFSRLNKLYQTIHAQKIPKEMLLGKIEAMNEIISSIRSKITSRERIDSQLATQYRQAKKILTKTLKKKQQIKKKQNELLPEKTSLQIKLQSLKEKQSRVQVIITKYLEEINQLVMKKENLIERAKEKGERPEIIREKQRITKELNRLEGRLESTAISSVDEEKIKNQKEKVKSLETYLHERQTHITNLRADLEARLTYWAGEIKDLISKITSAMKALLGDIFPEIQIKVTNINNPEKAGLYLEAVTKGETFREFQELSGGERVLAVEGLILALHTLTNSPLHAIDEFTQRLDEKNKALAFTIALRTQQLATKDSLFMPQFLFLCPEATAVELTPTIHHVVISEVKIAK